MSDSMLHPRPSASSAFPAAPPSVPAPGGRCGRRAGHDRGRSTGRAFRSGLVRSAVVAAGTAGILAAGASAASATALIGWMDPLPTGTVVEAPLMGTATLGRDGANRPLATCTTGSLRVTAGTVGPQLPLTDPALEVGSCTSTEPPNSPLLFRGLVLESAGGAEVRTPSTAAGYDGDLWLTSARFTLSVSHRNSPGTVSRCTFPAGNVVGRIRNSDHTVSFPDVRPTSGGGFCIFLSQRGLTATFGPMEANGDAVRVSPTP